MTLSAIYQSLKSYELIHKLGSSFNVLSSVKRLFSDVLSVSKLCDDYFEEFLGYGDKVFVDGVLSKYGYLYIPKAYPGYIASGSRYKTPKQGVQTSYETRFSICQYPIQRINSFKSESGNYCLCFLYPSDFDSFIMNLDDRSFKEVNVPIEEMRLRVEDKHKPILVILNENAANKFTEKRVKLSGVLSPIPKEISEELIDSFGYFKKEVYSNSFRPFAERNGLCLDCRNHENEFSEISKLQSLEGYVYIESHLEGLSLPLETGFFNDIIPTRIPSKHVIPATLGQNNKVSSFTIPGNVQIAMHEDNIFGFFAKLDLKNKQLTNYKLKELAAKYIKFETSVNDRFSRMGLEHQLKLDFIYDSEKVKLVKGQLLDSKEIDEIIRNDIDLDQVISWLKE